MTSEVKKEDTANATKQEEKAADDVKSEEKKEDDKMKKEEEEGDKKKNESTKVKKEESAKVKKESNTSAKKEEEEELDEEAVKAVAERLKFFFSDANVRQDFFLRKYLIVKEGALVADKSISAGAVPIEALLRFNTIRKLTEDPDVIIEAVNTILKDKLVVKDDDKSIARVKPFTRDLMDDNIPLSLYVKNLPTKENDRKQLHYDVQMEDIRKLFESYGEVSLVKLRFKRSRHSDDDNHTDDIIKKEDDDDGGGGGRKAPRRRYPMGDCLVEFEETKMLEKAAEDVLTSKAGVAVEPKRKLEMGENTLQVMTLKDYLDGLKKRKREKEDDDKETKAEDDKKVEEFTIEWKPGCVIGLKGLADGCDREAIIGAVMKGCDLTKDDVKQKKIFADFSRGQKDGAIRFPEPDLPKILLEKLKSGDVKICDAKVEDVEIKEGEDEKKYWENYIQFRKNQMRHRQDERRQRKKQKFRRNKTF